MRCIGNTTECIFGATFITDILVGVQLDQNRTAEDTALILQTAYTKTLDKFINGRNAMYCNRLFGIVADLEFFLNFVNNSVEQRSNKQQLTLERRSLNDLDRQLQDEAGDNTLLHTSLFSSSLFNS